MWSYQSGVQSSSNSITIPIYVELTLKEYNAFMKKYHEAYGHGNQSVQHIQVVRCMRPKHYEVAKAPTAYKTDTLLRWLLKL